MMLQFSRWMSRLALLCLTLALLLTPTFGAGALVGRRDGSSVFGGSGRPVTPAVSFHGFTLIGTSDVHGKLNSTGEKGKAGGGVARVATLLKTAKAANPGAVLALSAGDDLSGVYNRVFGPKAVYPLMVKAGYELVALGNHEFDRGPKLLAESIEASGLEALCSDLRVTQTPLEGWCAPYTLRVLGGIKVGFFSLMTEEFQVVTRGEGVAPAAGNLEAARRMVTLLREKGAQIVVAVTHIGLDRDKELAQAVPGVDVIFGGHSHQAIPAKLVVGNTLVVNGGEKGQDVIQLDVHIDAQGKVDPAASQYRLIPVTGEIAEDVLVQTALDAFKKELPAATPIGSTTAPWDFTSTTLRTGRSTASYLFCDILRRKLQAEAVLFNAGAFRRNGVYPAGTVTDAMLRDIDEFENSVLVLNLPGKHFKEILEHSATAYGRGGLLVPSGLRYALDLAQAPQTQTRGADGALSVTTAGARVTDIQIQDKNGAWTAIDPDKSYRVVVNSFLLDNEGDGYFWFKRYGTNVHNTYAPYGALVTGAFEETPVQTPPAADERVRVINAPGQ